MCGDSGESPPAFEGYIQSEAECRDATWKMRSDRSLLEASRVHIWFAAHGTRYLRCSVPRRMVRVGKRRQWKSICQCCLDPLWLLCVCCPFLTVPSQTRRLQPCLQRSGSPPRNASEIERQGGGKRHNSHQARVRFFMSLPKCPPSPPSPVPDSRLSSRPALFPIKNAVKPCM